jgi:hypothetical protein
MGGRIHNGAHRSGKYCHDEKTPTQTFINIVKLAQDRELDRSKRY